MPYMILVLASAEDGPAPAAAEGQQRYERMMRYGESLAARGLLLSGDSLGSDRDGARVRVRGGRRTIVDGPFTEAKEIVGGYFLLDCRTRDEALALANECPAAEWATLEVRPVGPCWEGAG